ncbi:MAG: J domain-containing protein [Janthinobacterium lividum]
MNLNSHHFDRIRSRSAGKSGKTAAVPSTTPCDHPGCTNAGEFRAPQGRDREGQYFCFCMEHVREYNATYDYFSGMTDDAVQKYQKEALVGHRPTWNMGVNRAAGSTAAADDLHPDSLGIFRARARQSRADAPRRPHYSIATTKALTTMGLDEMADAAAVKARYKQLVKQLHPDANGGDRSNEDKLRDIIRAYNFLKTIKLSPPTAGAAR